LLAPELAERVLQAVDDGFDEQLRVTMDLVRCPSVRGAEGTAQDLIARELTGRGYAVERWVLDPEELRAGAAGGRSLIVNGHVDVVPAGPARCGPRRRSRPRSATAGSTAVVPAT
jgi:acetylornithine deacetylase